VVRGVEPLTRRSRELVRVGGDVGEHRVHRFRPRPAHRNARGDDRRRIQGVGEGRGVNGEPPPQLLAGDLVEQRRGEIGGGATVRRHVPQCGADDLVRGPVVDSTAHHQLLGDVGRLAGAERECLP